MSTSFAVKSGFMLDTLRSNFGHFTANEKLRFAVNRFTLPFYPYLGLNIQGWQLAAAKFVFIHPLTAIFAEKLS